MAPDPVAVGIESVAANVRRLREKRGLTQYRLAVAADIEPRYVARMEAGEGNPTITVLIRVAVALDVKVTDLLRPAKMAPRTPGRPRKAK